MTAPRTAQIERESDEKQALNSYCADSEMNLVDDRNSNLNMKSVNA